ncbi:MAG: C-terminal helicase domain-containing protein, partial [Candidatus Aminicenantes bacterium]
ELTYARFALWHYVKSDFKKKEPYRELHRAGANLRGLMRILMFKRFESSVYAFRETIKRMIKIHEAFLLSIEHNLIPAGEEAQKILYGSDQYSEDDLITALESVTGDYDADKFDLVHLKDHMSHDLEIFKEILSLVNEEKIPPEKDAKLQKLLEVLNKEPLNTGKVLIFSESAETVEYLHDHINKRDDPSIRKASTATENKVSLVNRFAPKANRYQLRPGEVEINKLISTDVLSEGLNLQDCDKIINYDLHWNPVKLIQRFGRIDRIGSEYDEIFGFNFLPETALDRNLGLHDIVHRRIQDIHDTIGEDAKILDESEQLNEEEMYAI